MKLWLVFAKLLHMNKIKVYTLQGKWTGDFDSNNKWYKDEALKLKGIAWYIHGDWYEDTDINEIYVAFG